MTEVTADVGVRNFADQRQHRRVHRIRGEESGRGIEQARSWHHRVGLGAPGRERRTERHIGRTLLMPRMHSPDAVAEFEQGFEQQIVLNAGQRVHRIDAVGSHRIHGRLGGGHRSNVAGGGGGGLCLGRLHKGCLPDPDCHGVQQVAGAIAEARGDNGIDARDPQCFTL